MFDRNALLHPDPDEKFILRGVQYPAVSLLAVIVGAFGVAGMAGARRATHPILDTILWVLLTAALAASWYIAWCGVWRGALPSRIASTILFTLLSFIYIGVLVTIIAQAI